MNDNLSIYNKVRSVPQEALTPIAAGRLRGKSDINPMWRIKTLTEQFGLCGFGWKYEVVNKHLEKGGNNEVSAFVDINLYIKINNEWSEPIPGTGGSSFVANEKNGLYTNDECFKMALTDAISVACKAIGFGADVYWDKDSIKYNSNIKTESNMCEDCSKEIKPTQTKSVDEVISANMRYYNKKLCASCGAKRYNENKK